MRLKKNSLILACLVILFIVFVLILKIDVFSFVAINVTQLLFWIRKWAPVLTIGILLAALISLWFNLSQKLSKPKIKISFGVDDGEDKKLKELPETECPTYLVGEVKELIFIFENMGTHDKLEKINKQTLCSENSAVLDLSIMVYFQKGFIIIESERQNCRINYTNPPLNKQESGSPQGTEEPSSEKYTNKYPFNCCVDLGEYKDYSQYIYVPDPFNRKPPIMSSLRCNEKEYCRIKVKMPNDIILEPESDYALYTILFDISTKNHGVLENRTLQIKIKENSIPSTS